MRGEIVYSGSVKIRAPSRVSKITKARTLLKAITLAFFSVFLLSFKFSLLHMVFVLFFYIYGSIPFALIFTYLSKGAIIYKEEVGS